VSGEELEVLLRDGGESDGVREVPRDDVRDVDVYDREWDGV